jgi:hypothetical protein
MYSFFTFDGDYSFGRLNQLTIGSDGNIYGTVEVPPGKGRFGSAVFKMTPSGVVTILSQFEEVDRYAMPTSVLTEAPDGLFYGVSRNYIYRASRYGGVEIVHNFTSAEGWLPWAGVALSRDRRLYGTTDGARIGEYGIVYRLVVPELDGPYNLSVRTRGRGRVTASLGGIDCGGGATDCSTQYGLNSSVTLTPVAAEGWQFSGWTGDADCSDGMVTMSRARACEATFLDSSAGPVDYTLFWQHETTGSVLSWGLRGATRVAAYAVTPGGVGDADWKVVGSADFNGDGEVDLLWQNQRTTKLSVWYLRNATFAGAGSLSVGSVSDTNWKVRGVADVNADGKPDIIWHHQQDGRRAAWLLNGTTVVKVWTIWGPWEGSYDTQDRTDPVWKIAGVADFTRDGYADLLWQNTQTGALVVWMLLDAGYCRTLPLSISSVSDPNWSVRAIVDTNDDRHPDIVWQHNVTGEMVIWLMKETSVIGVRRLDDQVSDVNWRVVGGQ